MELSLERPGEHLFVRSFDGERVTVVDTVHDIPLVLSAQKVLDDWAPPTFADLDEAAVDKLCSLQPEIVLIGAGNRQSFLPPQLQAAFYQRGAGVEVMTVDAACRTFNVLVSEARDVVAALLLNP
jgi:uncharacterized protein